MKEIFKNPLWASYSRHRFHSSFTAQMPLGTVIWMGTMDMTVKRNKINIVRFLASYWKILVPTNISRLSLSEDPGVYRKEEKKSTADLGDHSLVTAWVPVTIPYPSSFTCCKKVLYDNSTVERLTLCIGLEYDHLHTSNSCQKWSSQLNRGTGFRIVTEGADYKYRRF